MADDLGEIALAETAAIRAQFDVLAGRVQEMFDILGDNPDAALSPWWFPRMNSEEARKAWEELVRWVDKELIPTYDGNRETSQGKLAEGNQIKACWVAHADVRDKLAALYWFHRGAYDRNASSSSPIDWIDRAAKTLETIDLKTCMRRCPHFEKKSSELTWNDRTSWIQDDVARRSDR